MALSQNSVCSLAVVTTIWKKRAVMNNLLEVPKFAREKDKADRWFENRGSLEVATQRGPDNAARAASTPHRALPREAPTRSFDWL